MVKTETLSPVTAHVHDAKTQVQTVGYPKTIWAGSVVKVSKIFLKFFLLSFKS